jgi:hypothetical protein
MSFSCQHVRSMPLTPADGRTMQDKLMIKDPVVFKIFKILERRSPIECSLSFSGQQGVGNLQTTRHSKNYVTCLQIASAIPLSSTVWYSKFGNIPELHGLVRGVITPSLKPSDALQNSSLSIGRARRLMDADQWVYKGPVYYQ